MTAEDIEATRSEVNQLLLKRFGIDLSDVDEDAVMNDIRNGEEAEAIVDGLAEDYELEELVM
jgi:hypothetical protein